MRSYIFQQHPWLEIDRETIEEISHQMPQFLIYERVGKKRTMWQCTACGERGWAKIRGKSGDLEPCPECRTVCTLKCSTRMRDDAESMKRWVNIVYFVARGRMLYAVGARLTRRFSRGSWDGVDWWEETDITPFEVWQFAPGLAREWKQECGAGGANLGMGWFGPRTPREPCTGGMTGENWYSLWETGEIDKTDMRYCRDIAPEIIGTPIDDGAEVMGVIRYLRMYAERPKLELAAKWGLYDVAKDWVTFKKTNGKIVNWEGNTPWEFLKIPKKDWKAYRESKCANVKLLGINKRSFRLPVGKLLEIADRIGDRNNQWAKYAAEIEKMGIPLKEQLKYMEKQCPNLNTSGKWVLWRDYLQMAAEQGRNMSLPGNRMPRDLQGQHDAAAEYKRRKKREEQAKALGEKYGEYDKRKGKLQRKYEYTSHGLTVRVPGNAEEIIKEGDVLRICVGGYAERHLSGATTILFLRRERKPSTPYICIEIDEGKNRIIQIHGYRNEHLGHGKTARDPEEKYHDFLVEWLGWVKAGSKKKTNKKEKEITA